MTKNIKTPIQQDCDCCHKEEGNIYLLICMKCYDAFLAGEMQGGEIDE